MVNSLTLFPKSIDPESLKNLVSKLSTSMKQAKGLVELKGSKGPLMSPGGPPSYSMVIEASWESLEDFMSWAQSSAAQDDKDFMVERGAILLFFEVKEL